MAKRKPAEVSAPMEYRPEPSVDITLPKEQQSKMIKSINLEDEVEVTFKGKLVRFSLDESCCHMGIKPSSITIESEEASGSMDEAIIKTRRRK